MTPLKMVVLVYLLAAGVIDIREYRISVPLTVLTAGVGVLHLLYDWETAVPSVFLSLLPGAGLILIGILSRQKIGMGDGITLLVCGLFLESAAVWEMLMSGLFFGSLFAVFLFIRKKGKNTEFPFLPFLCIGYMVGLYLPI